MANDRIIPHEGLTTTVTSFLKINGQEIDRTVEVLSVTINRELNKIPFAKIILKDGNASIEDFPLSNEDLFIPGNEIEVFAGYEANESLLFKGIIVRHGISIKSNSSILKLDCRDQTFQTTLERKNRYFTDSTDAEIIEDVLADYDLELAIENKDIVHAQLVQFESTDWNFLLARADANGQFCIIKDGSLKIAEPQLDKESVLTLQYGATILEFDGEIDARMQYTAVLGQSWDHANQALTETEAEDLIIQGGGNLTSEDLANIGGAVMNLRHGGQLQQEVLQAWTDAAVMKMRLRKVRGRVKVEGYAEVELGDWITLQGLGDRFNGLVFISGIRQEVNRGTWNTHFQFGLAKEVLKPQFSSPASTMSLAHTKIRGLQIGKVVQLQEDPDGEFRILVRLPIISSDEEGHWARVATLDAGENRGTFFLPDIGDEVIVGFLNEDPRNPVVLGMVHSSVKSAPIEVVDDNYEKGIITREQLKLLFNDEKKTVRIETPSGNKIWLVEDQGILLIDENKNKLCMDADGIIVESAKDLTLKAGANLVLDATKNVEIKAVMNFKAEASAGAEVSTSAVAVLKGSVVQIN